MAEDPLTRLRARLEDAARGGLLRRIAPPEGVDFVTNDYLGLASHPAVADAMARAAREEGSGARAARLLGGDRPAHRAAEERAARWLRAEAALLLPSGFQANLALLTALTRPSDVVLSDERNHASLVDAIRLSRARVVVYRHRDAAHLKECLRLHRDAPALFIATDAVFSITGAPAPLEEIAGLAREFGAGLLVDEAHAAGVRGPAGSGLAAELDLTDRVLARVVTGGKALGVSGAFVAGSSAVVEAVVNFGRAFLFTTAPPPAVAAGLTAAIGCVEEAEAARARLRRLSADFKERLRQGGVSVVETSGPIVFVPVGEPADALEAASRLRARGFDVRAVRPPTVPAGESGLRIVLHAQNSEGDAARLATELARIPAIVKSKPPAPAPPCLRAVAVVGTDTGAGKTAVASMLVLEALRQGPAAYWKPVQTGVGADDDTGTLRALAAPAGARILDPVFAFPEPTAPSQAAARAGVKIDRDALLDAAHRACALEGTLVVEGAGGLLVPLASDLSQDGLLTELGLPVVLVARTSLGTLNHTRLTLEALAARRIPVLALVLFGRDHPENVLELGRFFPPELIRFVRYPTAFDRKTLAEAAASSGLTTVLAAVPPWRGPRSRGGAPAS